MVPQRPIDPWSPCTCEPCRCNCNYYYSLTGACNRPDFVCPCHRQGLDPTNSSSVNASPSYRLSVEVPNSMSASSVSKGSTSFYGSPFKRSTNKTSTYRYSGNCNRFYKGPSTDSANKTSLYKTSNRLYAFCKGRSRTSRNHTSLSRASRQSGNFRGPLYFD